MPRSSFTVLFVTLISFATLAMAEDDPVKERHEMMEDMGDAAKVVGGTLKGDIDFDAVAIMDSFDTMHFVGTHVGGLFPEGSYVGGEKRAKETVWTDRGGFDAQLAEFNAAVETAILAAPQDLDALKKVGPEIFNSCKACHEDYRIPGN
jgi:cytochrome c556